MVLTSTGIVVMFFPSWKSNMFTSSLPTNVRSFLPHFASGSFWQAVIASLKGIRTVSGRVSKIIDVKPTLLNASTMLEDLHWMIEPSIFEKKLLNLQVSGVSARHFFSISMLMLSSLSYLRSVKVGKYGKGVVVKQA